MSEKKKVVFSCACEKGKCVIESYERKEPVCPLTGDINSQVWGINEETTENLLNFRYQKLRASTRTDKKMDAKLDEIFYGKKETVEARDLFNSLKIYEKNLKDLQKELPVDFIYPKVNFEENSAIEEYYQKTAKVYFDLEELLSESIISNYGIKGLQFMDIKCLQTLVGLREWFKKPVFVNNWKYLRKAGIKDQMVFDSRVCRFPDDEDYSEGSEHAVKIDKDGNIVKKSRAIDYDVEGVTAEKVRKTILANKNIKPFNLINRLEKAVGWNHNDFKPVNTYNRVVEFGK